MIDRNIRLRLLAVLEILKQAKQELSIKDILFQLDYRYSLFVPVADRRAIYRDIETMIEFGIGIQRISKRHNQIYYRMVNKNHSNVTH